jgi:DNA-binding NtrC family response regulator
MDGDKESKDQGIGTVLVVDDEKNILRSLRMILGGEGFNVVTASSGESALDRLKSGIYPDLILLDLKLPGLDGIQTMGRIREMQHIGSTVPVVMISGHAALSDAVEAVKQGAADFLEKPLERDRVIITVRNLLASFLLQGEVREMREKLAQRYAMVGNSAAMKHLFAEIEKVAPTRGRVLITGESGVGKELVAWAMHRLSPRVDRRFVKVNCAAIPGELIESELFGYEKGAFTGASGTKKGQFELATGGTLFLDEIGDMSPSAQAKVLRALQSGEITRVGGESIVSVDVRVIAATNKDIEEEVRQGRFREDLYFRLNVIRLQVPPLREHKEDIPTLVEHFLGEFSRENGVAHRAVSPEVIERLTLHHWPGNIRELKNVVERMAILGGETLTPADLPEFIFRPPAERSGRIEEYSDLGLREFREEMEKRFIQFKLKENDWNISSTARSLGIERTNLHKKIKALGISRDEG